MATFFGGQNYELLEFTGSKASGSTEIQTLLTVESNAFYYIQSFQATASTGNPATATLQIGYEILSANVSKQSFSIRLRPFGNEVPPLYDSFFTYDYNTGIWGFKDKDTSLASGTFETFQTGTVTGTGIPVASPGQLIAVQETASVATLYWKVQIVKVTGK